MIYYVGLDLHSDNTYIGLIDENENRLVKCRCPNDLSVILRVLEPYKEKIKAIAVESTYNWYWLVDGLMENGYCVQLANPSGFQPYTGLKHSDDKRESFFLAKLLKLGIFPQGYIYPKEERHLRDLLRKRSMLVRHRTMHILSFQNLANRNKCLSFSAGQVKSLKLEQIGKMFEDPYLIESAKSSITIIQHLDSEISRIEKILITKISQKRYYKNLLAVPGIGDILALTITLETGDINRFAEAGHYASYCRAVESKRTSNNKIKGHNNRKNGNKYLAWAYIEAANLMKRYCPPAKEFYAKKCRQDHKMVALKALTNKISKACFYMMRDNVPFDVNKIFSGNPKSNQIKESGSKPEVGCGNQTRDLIGKTAAIPSNQ